MRRGCFNCAKSYLMLERGRNVKIFSPSHQGFTCLLTLWGSYIGWGSQGRSFLLIVSHTVFHIDWHMHVYCSNSEITQWEQLPNGNGSKLNGIWIEYVSSCSLCRFTLAMRCFLSKHKWCHMITLSICVFVSDCCLFLVLIDSLHAYIYFLFIF